MMGLGRTASEKALTATAMGRDTTRREIMERDMVLLD
jgi:hypothetical protein